MRPLRLAGVAAILAGAAIPFLTSTVQAQLAQPVRCSAFLHNHDGSWSSFVDATFIAMHGPVHVKPGERLSGRGSPAQADLAHLLTQLCESD